MEVTVLGTSGGIPIPGRAQSGILVESKETDLLLDCGMAVPLRMGEISKEPILPEYIFLTHEHLDHIQDLPSLTKASWLKDEDIESTMFCPPEMVDTIHSVFSSVSEWERANVSIESLSPNQEVDIQELSIDAFSTPHTEESQGYVVSKGEKKVIYTGDTTPDEKLKDIGEACDLIIHELSLLEKTDIHTDPDGLVGLISGMNIDKILLTHFYPEVEKGISKIADEIQEKTGIQIIPAEDKMSFKI